MKKKGSPLHAIALVGSLGMEVILTTVGGAYLGKYLDTYFGTKPTLLIIGVFIGLTAGFLTAGYTLRAFIKD